MEVEYEVTKPSKDTDTVMKPPKEVVNTNKFTDRQLSDLYGQLRKDFADDRPLEMADVEKLSLDLGAKFSPGGQYAYLPAAEQEKVRTVVATFLMAKSSQVHAQPDWSRLFYETLLRFNAEPTNYYSRRPYVINHYYYSQSSWYEGFFWGSWLSSNNNQYRSNNDAQVFLVMIAIIITCIAFCYLLVAIAESLERFHHNEGWLQASISLLSIAAGALAGAAAVLAILNPVGLALCTAVGAGIVASALTVATTNYIQGKVITWANPDALDLEEPHRFKLTDNDIYSFEQNLDPTKVKLAIAALRAEIGELPSVCARLFWSSDSDKSKQALLNKVRDLRHGICDPDGTVEVSGMKFNLRPDVSLQPVAASYHAANDEQTVEGVVQGQGHPVENENPYSSTTIGYF